MRSQSRDQFNKKIREKENEQLTKEQELRNQKMLENEKEIKKIREMAVFKASGIRKYKALDGSKVPERALTVP